MYFDKKTYQEVKTAIKNGIMYPTKRESVTKFSYKGVTYLVSSCYHPRSRDIKISIDGEVEHESKLATFVNNLKDIVDLSACYTNVQIQDYTDKVNGLDPIEVEYSGLRDKALSRLVRQRRR